MLTCNRQNMGGGGVALYIQNRIQIENNFSYSSPNENIQLIAAQVKMGNTKLLIVECYVSDGNLNDIKTAIEIMFENLNGNLPIILVGDLNIDILSQSEKSIEFKSYMSGHGFSYLIDLITRPASRSCLDNIWISKMSDILEIMPGILGSVTPDHTPLFATFLINNFTDQKQNVEVEYRDLKNHNKKAFSYMLSNTDWSFLYLTDNIEEMVDSFETVILNTYNMAIPIKNKQITDPRIGSKENTNGDVWFDEECRHMRKIKTYLYKKK
jgi:hypothetical protein